MPYSAWVDESESDQRRDPHTYLLAAALIDNAQVPAVRERMRGLLLPGQRKLHWHDESAKRRMVIIEAVAELDALHLVIVRSGRPGDRPERRRRKCLERLLYELDAVGVDQMTMESREKRQNARDIKMVNTLLDKHVVRSSMRIHHFPGPAEATLWVPDLVAGAVVASRCDERQFLDIIRTTVEVTRIEVD